MKWNYIFYFCFGLLYKQVVHNNMYVHSSTCSLYSRRKGWRPELYFSVFFLVQKVKLTSAPQPVSSAPPLVETLRWPLDTLHGPLDTPHWPDRISIEFSQASFFSFSFLSALHAQQWHTSTYEDRHHHENLRSSPCCQPRINNSIASTECNS